MSSFCSSVYLILDLSTFDPPQALSHVILILIDIRPRQWIHNTALIVSIITFKVYDSGISCVYFRLKLVDF